MNIRIEIWNGHEIRFVEVESGEWRAVAEDVAKATGYFLLDELLAGDEFIDETFTIGNCGEYLALSNKGKLLLVSHWYGGNKGIIIPNVARTVQSILVKNNPLSGELRKILESLLDDYYLRGFRCDLPKGIRKNIEHLIGYKRKKTFARKQKSTVNTKKEIEYVYFLTADNGFTKIGRTKNLDERIHHFTTKLPYELEETLILKTPNSFRLESTLHKRFESKRKRGEWFLLTDDDIELVKKEYRTLITKRMT